MAKYGLGLMCREVKRLGNADIDIVYQNNNYKKICPLQLLY